MLPQQASTPHRVKVLVLVSELEDYTIEVVNGLARHVDVVLAVPRRRYSRFAHWFAPAVDVRLMDWPRHRSVKNVRFLVELIALFARVKPDVVHLFSHNVLWLNLAMPFLRSVPVVTTVHDVEVHPGDRETRVVPQWATSLVARQSHDIVVHGERLREKAIARFGKAPERVHVMRHPAITRYAELARREGLRRREDDAFVILMFGRIFAYKGLRQLIAAERLLADQIPNLSVVIAGRGDDPMTWRAEMGRPQRYDIRHRFIEDREVAQLFFDADLVVLPYVEASQSGVLAIAAAFGRPVVATDVGELRATIEPHGLGEVVPPGDPQRLADAIARFARQADVREQAGAAALAFASGPYAPEAAGAQAHAIYRSILHRRRSPRVRGQDDAVAPASPSRPASPAAIAHPGNDGAADPANA